MSFSIANLLSTRGRLLTAAILLMALLFPALRSYAADAPAGPPDVLVFTNGDQLTGKLLGSAGGYVNFHSDMAGDVSVSWDKIKELRSQRKFAVLQKGVKPSRKTPESLVPQGTISLEGQNIQVNAAVGETVPPIPAKSVDFVVEEAEYQNAVHHDPGFFHAWNGSATAGATEVSATQSTNTFNGGVVLVRTIPNVSWLSPRNRTTADFTGSYGKITTPGYTVGGTVVPSTSVKTAIYHADAERDEYLSERLYYLGAVAFDHNFSQSLDLQQIYGGGIGWTAIKQDKQTLDLKALAQYEKQSFIDALPGEDQNLIGSTFSAAYMRKLPKGMIFNQQVAYIPAWNNLHAYSVNEINNLNLPVYKRLALTIGTIDSYLNNPAIALPPVTRNSFQFTAGVTYTFK